MKYTLQELIQLLETHGLAICEQVRGSNRIEWQPVEDLANLLSRTKNPPRGADPVLLANQYRPWPPVPEGFDEWEYMGIEWRCDSGPAVTYANRGINDFCPEWCIREDAWPEGMGVYLKAVKKHKP
jgi:hypothetical protein